MTNLELTFYQDGENRVPIPAGFAVSQVEGENKVDKGLVIIDSDGNEFVWIPCGSKTGETYSTKEYEEAGNYVKSKNWTQYKYNDDGRNWKNTDSTGKDNTGTGENVETTSNGKITAKDSIEKYGGFYVARFEAGIPSNATFYVSNTSGGNYVGIDGENVVNKDSNARGADSKNGEIKDLKSVSKRGVQAWNFITQTNAKTVSENMYEDNNTVDSYLIDSNAWNYICGDIFVKELGEEKLKNSIKYGNYRDNETTDYKGLDCLWAIHKSENHKWKYATKYGKGSITSEAKGNDFLELATGASEDFKVYNIYDMAGNVWELTEETATSGSTKYGADRGGGFSSFGIGGPVVSASVNPRYGMEVNMGFRVVLYLK